jgi:hypothetical protein
MWLLISEGLSYIVSLNFRGAMEHGVYPVTTRERGGLRNEIGWHVRLFHLETGNVDLTVRKRPMRTDASSFVGNSAFITTSSVSPGDCRPGNTAASPGSPKLIATSNEYLI